MSVKYLTTKISEEFSESIQVKVQFSIKIAIQNVVEVKKSSGMRYTISDFIREAIYDKLKKEGVKLY